jgi:hypothetical protein
MSEPSKKQRFCEKLAEAINGERKGGSVEYPALARLLFEASKELGNVTKEHAQIILVGNDEERHERLLWKIYERRCKP